MMVDEFRLSTEECKRRAPLVHPDSIDFPSNNRLAFPPIETDWSEALECGVFRRDSACTSLYGVLLDTSDGLLPAAERLSKRAAKFAELRAPGRLTTAFERVVGKKESIESKHRAEEKAAIELYQEAKLLLLDSIKDLKTTNHGALPKVIRCRDSFEPEKPISVEQLVKDLLGPNASSEQLQFYQEVLLSANESAGIKKATDIVKPENPIVLPGQDKDGGVYMEGQPRMTRWFNGASMVDYHNKTVYSIPYKGDQITFRINHDAPTSSSKMLIQGDKLFERTVDGLERWGRDPDDKPIRWDRFRKTGCDCSLFYKGEETKPYKVTLKTAAGELEFKRSADSDEFLDSTGKRGIRVDPESGSYNLYRRVRGKDGCVICSDEDGKLIVTSDARGNVLSTKVKLRADFTVERFFKAGETEEYRARIEHRRLNQELGRTGVLELTRTTAGRLICPIYAKDGRKKLATVELLDNSSVSVVFAGRAGSKHWITEGVQSNEALEVTTTARAVGGYRTEIKTDNGDRVIREIDRFRKKESETYRGAEKAEWTRRFNRDGQVASIIAKDPSLNREISLSFDRTLGALRGSITTKGEKQDAILVGDTLLKRSKEGKISAQFLVWSPTGKPTLIDGVFNSDTATLSYMEDHGNRDIKTVLSVIPGVVDTIYPGGRIEGRMYHGVKSSITGSGIAMVERPNGSITRLNLDDTVDVWDEKAGLTVKSEQLSAEAASFLAKHRQSDRRMIAEIHAKFRGTAERRTQMDAFYKKVGEIDKLRDLTREQKDALRQNVLTHVAFPEAIVQGNFTFVCNATTIQRELAINHPDRYIDSLVAVLSGKPVKNIDGKPIKVTTENLTSPDLTGRDLASRVFQTMALNMAFGKSTFRNTVDGVGCLVSSGEKEENFGGIELDRMAMVLHALTGEEKATVVVESAEELVRLFRENKGRSMPLRCQSSAEMAHVYNLVGIDDGPPLKLLIQDHAGLSFDKSTSENGMTDLSPLFANGKTTVIFGNSKNRLDCRKIYKINDSGEIVVDKDATREMAQEREREED